MWHEQGQRLTSNSWMSLVIYGWFISHTYTWIADEQKERVWLLMSEWRGRRRERGGGEKKRHDPFIRDMAHSCVCIWHVTKHARWDIRHGCWWASGRRGEEKRTELRGLFELRPTTFWFICYLSYQPAVKRTRCSQENSLDKSEIGVLPSSARSRTHLELACRHWLRWCVPLGLCELTLGHGNISLMRARALSLSLPFSRSHTPPAHVHRNCLSSQHRASPVEKSAGHRNDTY